MSRSFAIVPAAGQSIRMGAHKLLLPWRGRPIIQHVLAAWIAAVDRVVIVIRADDSPLIAGCEGFDVDVVLPRPSPADMKASIQAGLRHIDDAHDPRETDVCLIAPADLPRLSREAIRRLIDLHDPLSPLAVVPVFGGKRGHPVLLPWSLIPAVHDLQAHESLNSLLKRVPVREAVCNDSLSFDDLDTVRDYAQLIEGSAPPTQPLPSPHNSRTAPLNG